MVSDLEQSSGTNTDIARSPAPTDLPVGLTPKTQLTPQVQLEPQTQLVQPTQSTQPTQLTESTQSTQPTQLTESTQSTQPTQLTQSTQLTQPKLPRFKIVLIIVAAVILAFVSLSIILVGIGRIAYLHGYGWPTQESVIRGLFEANTEGTDTTQYWIIESGSSQVIMGRFMDMVPPGTRIEDISLERGETHSDAIVTARLPEGGIVYYQINLERDGLGWKINNLDLYFVSDPRSTA